MGYCSVNPPIEQSPMPPCCPIVGWFCKCSIRAHRHAHTLALRLGGAYSFLTCSICSDRALQLRDEGQVFGSLSVSSRECMPCDLLSIATGGDGDPLTATTPMTTHPGSGVAVGMILLTCSFFVSPVAACNWLQK